MSLVAHLEPERATSERRSSARRKLRLELEPQGSAGSRVMIHDLSEQGMLLETDARLADGETVDLVIPEAGSAAATIVWNSGRYFGCRFENPLTSAAVSAALLRSPPPVDDERKRAIHDAVGELQSLAKVVDQIAGEVERAIGKIARNAPDA